MVKNVGSSRGCDWTGRVPTPKTVADVRFLLDTPRAREDQSFAHDVLSAFVSPKIGLSLGRFKKSQRSGVSCELDALEERYPHFAIQFHTIRMRYGLAPRPGTNGARGLTPSRQQPSGLRRRNSEAHPNSFTSFADSIDGLYSERGAQIDMMLAVARQRHRERTASSGGSSCPSTPEEHLVDLDSSSCGSTTFSDSDGLVEGLRRVSL